MKNMKLTFSLTLVALSTLMVSAQAWQWGLRGGAINSMNPQRSQDFNNINHITTDQAGNIYTLGPVGSVGLQVDGHPLVAYSAYSPGSTTDILVSSFKPDGSFRWAKVIGGSSDDIGQSISTDNMGNVYVSGMVLNTPYNPPYNQLHFDTDTIIPHYTTTDSLQKIMFMIQYDTAGTFQWLHMPEPDTVSFANRAANNSIPWRHCTDGNGDTWWMANLRRGQFSWAVNNIITQDGEYILKYNPQGQVTGYIKLDIEFDREIIMAPGRFIWRMTL